MRIACYTDIHDQDAMLNIPTKLRASAAAAARLTVEEFGRVDLSLLGGDYFSQYPYWNQSCAWPKANWEDNKALIVRNFAATAKGERVFYVSGNNDLLLADLPTAENQPYNTCEFYESGPMKQTLGVLADNECYKRYSIIKGEQAGYYYLAFHYVVDGFDFFGINLDPDDAFNNHDCSYDLNAIAWLEHKLDEIDPDGTKPVFVVGHVSATVRLTTGEMSYFDMKADRRAALIKAFAGHRNLFYLYGHVHGQHYLRSESWQGLLHFDDEGNVIPFDDHDNYSATGGASFHTVHMGGLRPFMTETPFEFFEPDGVTGVLPGSDVPQFSEESGTPKIAQYLIIDADFEKVTFRYRNTGSLPGYTPADKPKPYTVWLAK